MRIALICSLVLTASLASGGPESTKFDLYGDPLPDGAVMRLGTSRHRFPGATFQFTHDSKTIVAVSWGRYVSRLDAKTGQTMEKFILPVEDARAAYLFPDGRRAILEVRPPRGWAGEISWEVWDLERRTRLMTVSDVQWDWTPTFAPSGDLIAAPSYWSGTEQEAIALHLIDVRTGRVREVDRLPLLPRQSQCVLQPVFSADGKQVVYGSWSNGVALLRACDVEMAKSTWEISVPTSNSAQLARLPAGRWLVCDREQSQALDGVSGKAIDDRVPHVPAGVIVRTTSQGHRLILASSESGQRLHVWDEAKTRAPSGSAGWPVGQGMGWSLVPSPDGKMALVGNSPARLVDLNSGKIVWGDTWADGHTQAVEQLRFSADGSGLASAADDGSIRVWDVANGRQLGLWKASGYSTGIPYWFHGSTGFGLVNRVPMDLSADGRRLVFVRSAGLGEPIMIQVVDVPSGKPVSSRRLPVARAVAGWPELSGAVAFSPDGGSVVVTYGSAGEDSVLIASQTTAQWHFGTDQWTVLGSTEGSPVSRTALGRSRPVRLTYGKAFSTATGRPVLELAGAGFGPQALSADDRLVAGVGRVPADRVRALRQYDIRDLRVWDARTGDLLAQIPWGLPDMRGPVPWSPFAHRAGAAPDDLRWDWPKVMALNPTGRLLATSDPAGVRMWDVASARMIRAYPMAEHPPIDHSDGLLAEALAFTPDGSRLATGMPDGTILLWPVPTPTPSPPRANELPAVWADLMGHDPANGWRAAWRLMDDPAAAVKLIREHLRPADRVPAAEVAKLLADVDSPEFRRREAATRRLEAIIDQVVPAVRQAENAVGASAELRERLRKVLAAAPGDDKALPPRAAAQSRAVAVLEYVRSPEGRATLGELAGGASGAWLTREAQAALARLGPAR